MHSWHSILATQQRKLQQEHQLHLVAGAELELYLLRDGAPVLKGAKGFFNKVMEAARQQGVLSWVSHLPEKGEGQYELIFEAIAPVDKLIKDIHSVRNIIQRLSSEDSLTADFAPMPKEANYSNSLQLNIHLENNEGERVFWKEEDSLSEPLQHALAGLIALMPHTMPCFLPLLDSFKRFEQDPMHVPQRACWGMNNRTVALRLPVKKLPKLYIEHRLAGADALPEAVLCAIAAGIRLGLAEKPTLPEAIFGNANDAQYAHQQSLPNTLGNSYKLFSNNEYNGSYLEGFVEAAKASGWM